MKLLDKLSGNLAFGLNILLLFLLIFEQGIQLPGIAKVLGRAHPLLLHIPVGLWIFLALLPLLRKEIDSGSYLRVHAFVLNLAVLTAALTALMGLFLAQEDGYVASQVAWHKWTGAGVSFLSYGLWIFFHQLPKKRKLYHLLLYATTGLVVVAGHLGGSITHGENFLLAPLAPERVVVRPETPVYQAAVEPILKGKCYSCHNQRKSKGKLILTDPESIRKGGENGPVWVAGRPDSSEVIRRAHLPLEAEEHMPPEGKPQLSGEEIRLLHDWIASGADFEVRVRDWLETDSLAQWVEPLLDPVATESADKTYVFEAAPAAVIEKLNTPFRTVMPISIGSPALHAEIFVRQAYEENFLRDLSQVSEQLTSLNLSNLPITDEDLPFIASFPHLEKLVLNGTDIEGSGLEALRACENLSALALANTNVNEQGLEALQGMPALSEVYVWNTGLDGSALERLSAKLPEVEFMDGFRPDKNEMLKLPPPQLSGKKRVLDRGEMVKLENRFPGAIIRFTTDGSEPDSLESPAYTGPLPVSGLLQLKARTVKEGWLSSETEEWTFFAKGVQPDTAFFLEPPHPEYKANGAMSLFDGQKGEKDNYKLGNWMATRGSPFEVCVDLGEDPPNMGQLVISYLRNINSYIFPPVEVTLLGGNDPSDLLPIQNLRTQVPEDYQPNRVEAMTLAIPSGPYRFYKIIAKPLMKLPSWHRGAGESAWLFIDELLFYPEGGPQGDNEG